MQRIEISFLDKESGTTTKTSYEIVGDLQMNDECFWHWFVTCWSSLGLSYITQQLKDK